jgi:hypothetical protein
MRLESLRKPKGTRKLTPTIQGAKTSSELSRVQLGPPVAASLAGTRAAAQKCPGRLSACHAGATR